VTKPKMMLCPGSGQKVYGEDEPDGTVYCNKCGTSGLQMLKTKTVTGKLEFSVSDHKCRVNPIRPTGRPRVTPSRKGGRRDSGRR
jgi:hypothetical protein